MAAAKDPIQRFQDLLDEATAAGLPMANAVALATADEEGRPSVRMVLLKGIDERGFVFYTNLESRKARELRARPYASLCFHWPIPERQVRVEGRVEQVSDEEADAYFASRGRGSQIGAWASRQSSPLTSREELVSHVVEIEARFQGSAVERPPFWSGFRILPERIEFWNGKPDRLHERNIYVREGDRWSMALLYP